MLRIKREKFKSRKNFSKWISGWYLLSNRLYCRLLLMFKRSSKWSRLWCGLGEIWKSGLSLNTHEWCQKRTCIGLETCSSLRRNGSVFAWKQGQQMGREKDALLVDSMNVQVYNCNRYGADVLPIDDDGIWLFRTFSLTSAILLEIWYVVLDFTLHYCL